MDDIISNEEKTVFEIVNFVSICTIVCMFGMTSNIINVVVFYEQGFNSSINIAFFAMAISDLFALVTLQWASITLNPLFAYLRVHWSTLEVMYLTGGWPHVCFSRVTGYITIYVTAERYLSVALPLTVKSIITRKTTIITICIIYIVNIASMFPEYATTYLDWRWVSSYNMSVLGIMYTSSRASLEGVTHILHSLLGMTCFSGVIIFTTLLVSKLRKSSQWRQDATSDSSKLKALTNRDKKTMKMVVLIAIVLIVCYTPSTVVALAVYIVGPEFNISGRYLNICTAVWSIAVASESINSSVNIFIYFSMSSKYRDTFKKLILKCRLNKIN